MEWLIIILVTNLPIFINTLFQFGGEIIGLAAVCQGWGDSHAKLQLEPNSQSHAREVYHFIENSLFILRIISLVLTPE